MKKLRVKKLLSSVLALAMTASLFSGFSASAANKTTTAQTDSDTVKIGAEVLLESKEWKDYLKGKNVALFTNQVCVDSEMNHLADKLVADPDINLVCLFGGEHGLRGAYQAGASVPHCIDATTGLINWSLYNGGTIDTEALGIAALEEGMEDPKNPNRPTRAMLTGNNGKWYDAVDVILFDLQEIGSKTWTYLYNLADLMAACIESEKYYGHAVELIVLDRPSSISSDVVEGPINASNNNTGFGRFPLPSRYGLTMGEVALLYSGENWTYYWATSYPGGPENLYGEATALKSKDYSGMWPWETEAQEGDTEEITAIRAKLAENFKDKLTLGDCSVKVIPCEGYTRDMYWDETGLEFILPSPNMPTVEACLIYAGTVWFEGLPINEGRGTTKPFELISAPYIDGEALAERLNALGLAGVTFRAASTTTLSTNQLLSGTDYVGTLSHGVQIHITDKRAFSPIEMQTALCLTLQAMYGADKNAEDYATQKTDGNHYYTHWQIDYRAGADWVSSTLNAFPVGSSNEEILAKTEEMLARMEKELQPYLTIREKYLMDEYNVPADKTQVTTLQPQITLGYEDFLANAALYSDLKIGLVTNQSGVDTNLNHLADVLAQNSNVNLTTLFSTGYGLRGEFQTAEDGEYVDEKTGLTVYRLNENAPTAEQLKNVDMLLFDIQDTGSRYTSVAKLLNDCIKACAANGKTLAILDRPNPLGGDKVEGPVDSTYSLPTRYGMTVGELAQYLANKQGVSNVKVFEMTGWTRDMLYEETGLQFVQTDRKVATPTTLLTYSALGWLEGTSSGYGWGTTKTYEFFGAPYMKEQMVAFANALNALNLSGVRFRLAAMTPWNNSSELADIEYYGTPCYGVQMHILNEHAYNSVETILGILTTMQKFFPDDLTFSAEFDAIVGSSTVAADIKAGKSAAAIANGFNAELNTFKAARAEALIYDYTYTVKQYDTWGHIALNYYGTYEAWTALAKVNNYAKLTKGTKIVLPEVLGKYTRLSAPVCSNNEILYTVKAGDTLGDIAVLYYGNINMYKAIYQRNSDRIRNINTIYEGQVIVLPSL